MKKLILSEFIAYHFLLLAAWGPCQECPEDLNDDEQVGFDDLLLLLAAWGPCE